ncbi:MAG: hypothetical protein FJ218_09895 [Ignavibacteria bacterium]|nr:hypothetical protein [Ignavibacteria bacterium]
MAEQNGKLIELVAEMLHEMRKFREGQNETNKRLGNLEERLERLEQEQMKTNTILRQHTRDLMRIAELLDTHVVHWGDKISIHGKTTATQTVGVVSKVE